MTLGRPLFADPGKRLGMSADGWIGNDLRAGNGEFDGKRK